VILFTRLVAVILIAGYAASAALPCEVLRIGASVRAADLRAGAAADAHNGHAHDAPQEHPSPSAAHAEHHATGHADHARPAAAAAAASHGSDASDRPAELLAQCPCGCSQHGDAARAPLLPVGYALTAAVPVLPPVSNQLQFEPRPLLLASAPALADDLVPI
jgi:hypothetical protein